MKPRRKWVSMLFTLSSALLILTPALLGFSRKFVAFLLEAWGSDDGVFAVSPVINYLLASIGFVLLLGWAVFHGMFRDIEQPKRTMLEVQNALDDLDPTPEQRSGVKASGELSHA